MSSANSKNKFFLSPSKFRIIFILSNLIICWGAVFYKARTIESLPWSALLIVTFFILGILTFEVIISFRFTEYLAFAVYGFLFGAGINVIIQGLLNRFQGLNWAFQSPILFSLGTLLLGFLGTIIFISHQGQIKKNIPWESLAKNQRKTKGNIRKFITLIWIITLAVALGLCVNLLIILRIFNSPGTDNPLRKPLWFSLGIIIFVFMVLALARKKLMSIGIILLPGLIIGLIWASIFRDMFEWVYLKYPEFPLSSEVLEVLLIINFCYLGTAWLNKALPRSQ
jgi:hypothetical protein